MGIIVRSKKGRMGLETDNRANWGCRVYRFISPETKEAFKELINEKQMIFFFLADISAILSAIFNAIGDDDENWPVRGFITLNYEEDFLSIILLFSFKKLIKQKINNNDLRYKVAEEYHKNKLGYIYANFYEIHKPIGSWDSLHCDEAPLIDFSYEFINRELKEQVVNYVNEDEKKEGV